MSAQVIEDDVLPEEVATVLAAQTGDDVALARLLQAYLPLVRGIAGRALHGDDDLAALDDVVQDVMVRAVAHLGSLRDPARVRAWLVAITVRQVRDRRRGRRAAAARLVPLDDVVDLRDCGADPVDAGEARWLLQRQHREVLAAVALLAPVDREVLRLWALERQDLIDRAELAARLGITPAHAAVRVLRARTRLDDARRVARAAHRRACLPLRALLEADPASARLTRTRRHVAGCEQCAPAAGDDLLPAELLLVTRPVQAALAARPDPGPGVARAEAPARRPLAPPCLPPAQPSAVAARPPAAQVPVRGSAEPEAGHARRGHRRVVVQAGAGRGQRR